MNSKFKNIMAAIAIILACVLTLGLVMNIGYSAGWFNKNEAIDSGEDDTGNAVITEGESNGITLLSASLKAAAGSTAESTYELTATVTPSYATNPEVAWSIAWDTTSSLYGDDWYNDGNRDYGTSELDVTDFVDISAATGSSITVSCYQPFGCPIIVTASTTDGTNLTATCQVDYQTHVTGVSLSTDKLADLSSTSTSTASIGYVVDLTYGTISADYIVTYSAYFNFESFVSYIVDYGSYWKNKYFLNCEYYIAEDVTSTSQRGTILTYSKNWETFFKSLLNGNYDYDITMLADIYNALNNCGYTSSDNSGNNYVYDVSVSVKDNIKSTSYSDSNKYYFNSLDDFPTFSTTNLVLNVTNITF